MLKSSLVKSHLKSFGIKPGGLRVRCDHSVNIRVVDLSIDLEKVKKVSRDRFESYSHCESTGEILQGGNTFVTAKYCEKSLYGHYCNEEIDAFLEKTVPERYSPDYRISWAAEDYAKNDSFLGSINVQAKTLIYREILSSLVHLNKIKLAR